MPPQRYNPLKPDRGFKDSRRKPKNPNRAYRQPSNPLTTKSTEPISRLVLLNDLIIEPKTVELSEACPSIALGLSSCCEDGQIRFNKSDYDLKVADIHCQFNLIESNGVYRTEIKDNSYDSSTYIENNEGVFLIGYCERKYLNNKDIIRIGYGENCIRYRFCDVLNESIAHANSDKFTIPTMLSKYRKCGHDLGIGASAKVFLVEDSETNRKSACKIVLKEGHPQNTIEHLLEEPTIIARLNHENIIKIYHAYHDNRRIVMMLEYMEGEDLYSYVQHRDPLGSEEVSLITFQLLRGLEYLHDNRVIHRDLKPNNLLFKDSTCRTIKISDFGSAKYVTNSEGDTVEDFYKASIVGRTPLYSAPEVCRVILEEKSDIHCGMAADMWSLGLIVYFLIFGSTPFNEEESTTVYDVCKQIISWNFNPKAMRNKEVQMYSFVDLLENLLIKDWGRRRSAKEALLRYSKLSGVRMQSHYVTGASKR